VDYRGCHGITNSVALLGFYINKSGLLVRK